MLGFDLAGAGAFSGLLDPLVRFFEVRLVEASAGLTLILAGRWLLRAEAIASVIRTLGLFAILLGVLAAVGAFDPGALVEAAQYVLAAVNGGGSP